MFLLCKPTWGEYIYIYIDLEDECPMEHNNCVTTVLVYASGWKTARVVVLFFASGGWVGWGGVGYYSSCTMRTYVDATLLSCWVGWGGILRFMYHAYIRGCYAAATSLVRGWVGWCGIFMYHAYRMQRCCYVTGQRLGGVGWDINVHVPCVHTWMPRCCYVTGQGLGGVGWDINVHVPCVP